MNAHARRRTDFSPPDGRALKLLSTRHLPNPVSETKADLLPAIVPGTGLLLGVGCVLIIIAGAELD